AWRVLRHGQSRVLLGCAGVDRGARAPGYRGALERTSDRAAGRGATAPRRRHRPFRCLRSGGGGRRCAAERRARVAGAPAAQCVRRTGGGVRPPALRAHPRRAVFPLQPAGAAISAVRGGAASPRIDVALRQSGDGLLGAAAAARRAGGDYADRADGGGVIASDFEFRRRFWIIFAIFAVAFSCYFLDHKNAVAAAVDGADAVYHAAFGVAALVAFVAAGIRTWASAYLKTEVVKDPSVRTERLVADGPYRYVRNPLYLGTLLLAVAFAPLASRLGAVVLMVGMAGFIARLIGREEQALLASQGAA